MGTLPTLAPRPFSPNLLCDPVLFNPVIALCLRQSIVSYVEGPRNHLVWWSAFPNNEIFIRLRSHSRIGYSHLVVHLAQMWLSANPSLKVCPFRWRCIVNKPITFVLELFWAVRTRQSCPQRAEGDTTLRGLPVFLLFFAHPAFDGAPCNFLRGALGGYNCPFALYNGSKTYGRWRRCYSWPDKDLPDPTPHCVGGVRPWC